MEIVGKSVCGGIAIGKLKVYGGRSANAAGQEETAVGRDRIAGRAEWNAEKEKQRFEKAQELTGKQLKELYEKARLEVGEETAVLFEAHQMILEDGDFLARIFSGIEDRQLDADEAVLQSCRYFSNLFANMEEEYMRERAADIWDVSNRIVRNLHADGGNGESEFGEAGETAAAKFSSKKEALTQEPVILLAQDLSPSETVQLDKSSILAFVTRLGSANSHTAILARALGIPALIGVEYPEDADGKMAIVDGRKGLLILDPSLEILQEYRQELEKVNGEKSRLQELRGKENITLDGRKVDVFANMGSVEELESVLANDAGGIGLFRSEFLYLEAKEQPSEEEQFYAYRKAAESMQGRKVIIRTLDMGADKQAPYMGLEKEENPALGYRGIRICLDRREMFKTQLRAILRAANYGNVAMMLPMITSLWEVQQVKEILQQVRDDLSAKEIPYGEVQVGVMIETPAAVWMSRELAEEVDFFSVGSNDLTQYTLAADRQNPKADAFYDSHHPALLKSFQMVVDNGHAGGCYVGICGELAADLSMTETLLRIGFDELSVTPSMVLKLREKIRGLDLRE